MVAINKWVKHLITIHEAEQKYDVPVGTMYNRVKAGTLTAYKINNKLYVNPADFNEWDNTMYRMMYGKAYQEIPKLHAQGMSDAELARHFDVSRQRIFTLRNKLGLKANPRKPRLPKGTYLQ